MLGRGGSTWPGEPGEKALLDLAVHSLDFALGLGAVRPAEPRLSAEQLAQIHPRRTQGAAAGGEKTVSRSVSSSRLTPPRSTRQDTSRSKVTLRVQLVAIRIAAMRLWPRTATSAHKGTSLSPSGQAPRC